MNFYNASLSSTLFNLGNVFELKFSVNPKSVSTILLKYQDYWKKYNPRDGGIPREGIPITTLDGDINNIIGLDSLPQYNKENNTTLRESDFSNFTSIARDIKDLEPLLDCFTGHVQRSLILRLNRGGYFPPHRDAGSYQAFRILIPINFDNTIFNLDGTNINFKNGNVYVVNTLKVHHAFSFVNNQDIIIFNIALNENTVEAVYNNLEISYK
jgi:hypothetical protein